MLFYRFFQKSPEALQLFDGEGNTQSPEFRAHAVRLIRRMNEEMEQLDDDSSEEHNHDEGAPLINTTPAIREVCMTVLYIVQGQYATCLLMDTHLNATEIM